MKFSKEEKDILTQKIQWYFREELDRDIGSFDAQFLLDFFSEEIGPYFYNRALYDAAALLTDRMDSLTDALFEIEKVTQYKR
ncbi:DUF2164 domain-containing protein [Gilvimarinus algae]|uniref:DUF2164 domain-containing protein n=1 Tax=Gilvimarinus algae TaxID=3058037 RepID=A0ABT8T938_9GAMM|nr:DUF2164 domain-containing protein [Gilvimarinus sp. SDUM040014]MDO3380644.1 DUF2164 domain-containing protein [Gilvimarinus sp. SDUM040014]